MSSLLFRRRTPDGGLSCRQVAKVLQSYLDGMSDDVTAAQVAAHLEACRDCGLEADTYSAIKDSLHRRGTPPRDLRQRLDQFAEQLPHGVEDHD